jgi:hypothetical protein
MLNPFKRKDKNQKPKTQDTDQKVQESSFDQAMKRTLASATPLQRASLCGKFMLQRLTESMSATDPHGVRIENLLCYLGALAGYSCQAGLRKEYVKLQGQKEESVFMVLGLSDGTKAYAGPNLQKLLIDTIWSLVGGGAERIGQRAVYDAMDVEEMIKHSAETIGNQEFGVLRVEKEHQAKELPQESLKSLWPVFEPMLDAYTDKPLEWPLCFAVAIQEAMVMTQGKIDPKVAMTIVMESALTTSKVDLGVK